MEPVPRGENSAQQPFSVLPEQGEAAFFEANFVQSASVPQEQSAEVDFPVRDWVSAVQESDELPRIEQVSAELHRLEQTLAVRHRAAPALAEPPWVFVRTGLYSGEKDDSAEAGDLPKTAELSGSTASLSDQGYWGRQMDF